MALPKKECLSLAKNWRSICLLDVGSKILSSIMVKHMQALMEQVAFKIRQGSARSAGWSVGSSR